MFGGKDEQFVNDSMIIKVENGNIEGSLRLLKNKFNLYLKPEVDARQFPEVPQKKIITRRREDVPLVNLTPFGRTILNFYRSQDATLLGIDELPEDPAITTVIAIIKVIHSKEEPKFIIALDTKKQIWLDKRKRIFNGLPRWGFPGGSPRPGENFQAALLREVKEETGINGIRLYWKFIDVVEQGTTGRKSLVVATQIPFTIRLQKGFEQEAIKAVSGRMIEFYIKQTSAPKPISAKFLPNHGQYWKSYCISEKF